MKIYSWNVFVFNKKIDSVCKFIEGLDFDVLCLQEVTPELLSRLKSMPLHITYHVDVLRLFKKDKTEMNYVVILSKQDFHAHGTMQFPDFPFPLYTRLLIRFAGIFKWSWIAERGLVYADIRVRTKTIRIYSIHLTLWGPGNRAQEFALLAKELPKEHSSIICGDFNVIEYGPMKVLNVLLGASLKESTPWYPERELFEEQFAKHDLRNPLRGMVTHKFSRSQLDHILVSEEIEVTDAWVHPARHGSDHYPVGIEFSK